MDKKDIPITEQVVEILKKPQSSRIAELENLVKRMNQKGLLKKQSFGLPLVDTIGKTLYSSEGERGSDEDGS